MLRVVRVQQPHIAESEQVLAAALQHMRTLTFHLVFAVLLVLYQCGIPPTNTRQLWRPGILISNLWSHLVAVHVAGAGAEPQPQPPEGGVRHICAFVRPCIAVRRCRCRWLRGHVAADG